MKMKDHENRHSYFEWIQLFISFSIPVAIAVYTILENNRELSIATANRAQDLDIADNEQKDLILHECQKQLNKLIEKYGTNFNESSSISLVARFTTLSALNRLDSNRRNFLIDLLYEAKLITYQSNNYQPAVVLRSANLTGLNLSDQYERRTLFCISLEGTIMVKADFHEMNIYGARFKRSILIKANFASTRNTPAFDEYEDIGCLNNDFLPLSFAYANLTSTSFFAATYDNADFTEAKMINSNLDRFFCINCLFVSTNMQKINLQHAEINNSSFMFAELNNANLYGSIFGVNVDFYRTTLSYSNAAYTNFTQCQLIDTQLSNTIFDHAVFIDSNFSNARMDNVSMQYTRVINVNLANVNLNHSDWRYSYCNRCIFNQVDFTNADLSHATFIESVFEKCTITEEQLKRTAALERSILNGNVLSHK